KRTESGEDTQRWKIILRGPNVGNVQRAMLAHPAKPWLIKTHLESLIEYGYRTKMSSRNHTFPFTESQRHIVDPTNHCSYFDDRSELRRHRRRRAADDAQHLGGRRLMLQGLSQFCFALLQLFEQAHVLDGDYGLGGEGFEKCDLFFGEGPYLGSANLNRT